MENKDKKKQTEPKQAQPGINPIDYQISILSQQIASQSVEISKLKTVLALAQTEIAQLREKEKPKE